MQEPQPLPAPDRAPGSIAQIEEISFFRLIGTSTGVKLVVDTTVQIFNPFLAIIAAGLGTNVIVMGRLVSLRSIMGLFAPLFGAMSDRVGYRRTIRLALLFTAAGILLVGLSPNIWIAAIGMGIMGLGTGSFVPMLHAYLSGKLPYTRRARGLGIVEYSWALTGIFGLSLVGWLIAATNWRVPMVLLGVLLLIGAWVFSRMPAAPHPPRPAPDPASAQPGLLKRTRTYFAVGPTALSTYATILAGAFNYFAAMSVMIIYGAWFGDAFGLGAAALGTVALVFGLFDLVSSVAVSLFTDKLGKRYSVMLGCTIALLGYMVLPWLTFALVPAVLGVAVARAGFEFAVVANFPLLSEQAPAQRGKVLALGSALGLVFVTLAGFTSPWLYTHVGIQGVIWVSATSTALALLILFFGVRERGGLPDDAPAT
jgi:predicted MFS family arabinose efflux permease